MTYELAIGKPALCMCKMEQRTDRARWFQSEPPVLISSCCNEFMIDSSTIMVLFLRSPNSYPYAREFKGTTKEDRRRAFALRGKESTYTCIEHGANGPRLLCVKISWDACTEHGETFKKSVGRMIGNLTCEIGFHWDCCRCILFSVSLEFNLPRGVMQSNNESNCCNRRYAKTFDPLHKHFVSRMRGISTSTKLLFSGQTFGADFCE